MSTVPEAPQVSPEDTASVLRRAAAKMRETALAEGILRQSDPYYDSHSAEMSRYEVEWPPAVALAVADLLEDTAAAVEVGAEACAELGAPFALTDAGMSSLHLARTYLGGTE